VEADCIGSAAHVTMLSRMPAKARLFSAEEKDRVIAELVAIMRQARAGSFDITLADQDVHLAVERTLTGKLGDLGKKIHTARSRNDQVAVDLRLFAKQQLLELGDETIELVNALLGFAAGSAGVPMVGRTHQQPAMPSSVGLWASAYAESLLEDADGVMQAYRQNDQCPLGSAAGYGVPLPIDRQFVSDLLGFSRPCHTVLHAGNARGKVESAILGALVQIMISLSRLAQDLILFTLPEFGYFRLPADLCTGSSIMPQKKNPDVLELVRAKASRVLAAYLQVVEVIKSAPSGYNRDVQETKKPFLDGLETTRACLRIMKRMVTGLEVNEEALRKGFTPEVFATDRALELVGQGIPFRDAYHQVKSNLPELSGMDPAEAVAKKTHLGAPAGLALEILEKRSGQLAAWAKNERSGFYGALTKLLGVSYPLTG
jgi:argininosuccinate lyase